MVTFRVSTPILLIFLFIFVCFILITPGFSVLYPKNLKCGSWFYFLCFSWIFPATKRVNFLACFMGLVVIRSLVTYLLAHMIVLCWVEWWCVLYILVLNMDTLCEMMSCELTWVLDFGWLVTVSSVPGGGERPAYWNGSASEDFSDETLGHEWGSCQVEVLVSYLISVCYSRNWFWSVILILCWNSN